MLQNNRDKALPISEESVRIFEKAETQLESFSAEFGILSKKTPKEQVNKFKLGFVNQVLETANLLLGDNYRPFLGFTTFDVEVSLPTISDVVMMVSQYLRSMNKFRTDHAFYEGGNFCWNVLGLKFPDLPEAKRAKDFD